MKFKIHNLSFLVALVSAFVLTSCYTEDPGPIQEFKKQFTEVDFDRLEMGDAFEITVVQGSLFEIEASGDRRNIDDLEVIKEGTTLIIRYTENRNRRHNTSINIKMPSLRSVTFSGASHSKIEGFSDLEMFDINLSGASICQLDVDASHVHAIVSGASYLYMNGTGEDIHADLSGASVLKAFQYPVTHAIIRASGASDGHVMVTDNLTANASGASVIIYRGDPAVDSEVSGASTVRKD